MAIMEFSVNPIGTGSASVSRYVARAIQLLKKERGIKFTTTPMGTIAEGKLERLLAVIPEIHEALFAAGVPRTVTIIKIDDRRDKPATMSGKMESLKRELGEGEAVSG